MATTATGATIPGTASTIGTANALLAALFRLVDIQTGSSDDDDNDNSSNQIFHGLFLHVQRGFLLQLIVGLLDEQRNNNNK